MSGDQCQTDLNFNQIIESIKLDKLEDISNLKFYIEFISHDSQGTYNNTIEIFKANEAYISYVIQVLDKDGIKIIDTTITLAKYKRTKHIIRS